MSSIGIFLFEISFKVSINSALVGVFPLYESTDKLSKLGIINGSDITSEAGLTKMMYLLGKKLNLKEIKEAFSTSICGEQTV